MHTNKFLILTVQYRGASFIKNTFYKVKQNGLKYAFFRNDFLRSGNIPHSKKRDCSFKMIKQIIKLRAYKS